MKIQFVFVNVFLFAGLIGISACNIALESPKHRQARNPIAAKYNVELGMTYLQNNDRARAKEKLLLALKQAPHWPVAIDAMAYYFEMTGDIQQAGVYYKKALAKSPKDGLVLNNYGAFLCRIHEYQEAQHYFLAAAKDPNYLNSASAYENAGLCAMNIPDYQNAQVYFNKALLLDPGRPISLIELAQINNEQKHYNLAKKYLDEYLKYHAPDAQSSELKAKLIRK